MSVLPWHRRALDRLLDSSVVLSFDQSGYRRHAARFDPADLDVDLSGKVCLITGANSGLGRAASVALARLGAEVWMLCRSARRGTEALEAVRAESQNPRVHLELVDVSSLASVEQLCCRLPPKRVDVLVHNAGVLPPRRQLTDDGLELTWATNVVGPFLMTHRLLPRLEAAPEGRVITVSSGGMYLQRLDLSDLGWERRRFDGVKAYALTKRAEVVLTELWAARTAGSGLTHNSMHPGWADTPAVRASLPRFHRVMAPILRTPEQGADTIVWLAACPRLTGETGRFWFDREVRPTVVVPGTREDPADRERLWQLCLEQSGLA